MFKWLNRRMVDISDSWMVGWFNGLINKCLNSETNGDWLNGKIDKCLSGPMVERFNSQIVVRFNGQTDKWLNDQKFELSNIQIDK